MTIRSADTINIYENRICAIVTGAFVDVDAVAVAENEHVRLTPAGRNVAPVPELLFNQRLQVVLGALGVIAVSPPLLPEFPDTQAPALALDQLNQLALVLLFLGLGEHTEGAAGFVAEPAGQDDTRLDALDPHKALLVQAERVRRGAEDAFRVLTLEGNNWYSAGESDRAVEPYEQAMALRPEDVQARNNVAIALQSARLGSIAAHQTKALSIHEDTLKRIPRGSLEWAMTQNNLGTAWAGVPTGDLGANLRKAVAAYEAALTVYTRDAYPAEWAVTQINLGSVWAVLPTGERGENMRKGIGAFEAALTVLTRDADPVEWATAQHNLGTALTNLPTGDQAENARKAIAAFEAALTVRTRDVRPAEWAVTQANLGGAWADLPTGDSDKDTRKAVAAYEAALTV